MLSNRPKQRRTEFQMPFEMPSAEDLVKERAQLSQESDKCRLLIENEELQKLRRLCNDSNTTETTLKKAQAPSFIVAPEPLLQRLLENPCLQGSNNKLLEVYLELITTKTDDVIIETTEEMLFDIEECVLTEYETWSMDDKNTVELLCWLFVVALWKNNGLPKVISLFLSILTMQQQNVIEAVSDALIFAANGGMTVLLAALDLTKGPQPQHKLFTKHLCNVTLNSIAPKPETEPTSICKRVLQAWGELNIEQQFWAIEAVARGIAATRYEDNWSISEETDLQKLVNVAMAPTSPNLKYSVLHVAYQLPGQYAFPQMPGAGMGQLSPQMLQMPSGAISMAPNPSMALNSPFQIPQPRLPVMVMPYHSKASDKKYKKRKRIKNKHKESSSSSSSDSHSSSKEYVMRSKKKHRKKQKRQVLTPVISYVTRNGDIVYQKKVKKEKAGDWLELGKRPTSMAAESGEDIFDTKEITIRDLKQKFDFKKKQRRRTH